MRATWRGEDAFSTSTNRNTVYPSISIVRHLNFVCMWAARFGGELPSNTQARKQLFVVPLAHRVLILTVCCVCRCYRHYNLFLFIAPRCWPPSAFFLFDAFENRWGFISFNAHMMGISFLIFCAGWFVSCAGGAHWYCCSISFLLIFLHSKFSPHF